MRIKTALLLSTMMIGLASIAQAQSTSGTTEPPCVTQGQLTSILEKQGYSNIKLSEVTPNAAQPRPDVSCRSNPAEAATTPVHHGWNGTAMKDGKMHNIYVDDAGRVSAKD